MRVRVALSMSRSFRVPRGGKGAPAAAHVLADDESPLMLFTSDTASHNASASHSSRHQASNFSSGSGSGRSGQAGSSLAQRTSMYVSTASRDASFAYSELSSAMPRDLAQFSMPANLPYGGVGGRLRGTRTGTASKSAVGGGTSGEVSPSMLGLHLTEDATPCTTSLATTTTTAVTASLVRVVGGNASTSTAEAASPPASDLRADASAPTSAASFLDTVTHRLCAQRPTSPAPPTSPYVLHVVPVPEGLRDAARPTRVPHRGSVYHAPSMVSEPLPLPATQPTSRLTSPVFVSGSFSGSISLRSYDRLTRTFSGDPRSPLQLPTTTATTTSCLESPITPGVWTRSGSVTAEFPASSRHGREEQAATAATVNTTFVPEQHPHGSAAAHAAAAAAASLSSGAQLTGALSHMPASTHAITHVPLRIHWCCASHWRAVQRTERGAQWALDGQQSDVYCVPARHANAAAVVAAADALDCRSPLGGPSSASRYECATPTATGTSPTTPPRSAEQLPPTHLHDIEVRTLPSFLALTASTMYAATAAVAAATHNSGASDAFLHPVGASTPAPRPGLSCISSMSGAEAPTCEFCGRAVETWPCDVDDDNDFSKDSATCTITTATSSSLSGAYTGASVAMAPRPHSLHSARLGSGAAAGAAAVLPSAMREALASAHKSPYESVSTTRTLLSSSESGATMALSEAAGAGVAVVIDLVPASEPWTLADAARQEALLAAATQLL